MGRGISATGHRLEPGSEVLASLRSIAVAVSRPANLIAIFLVLIGWAALISWTGNGAGGWQARACAGLDLVSRACAEVRPVKDASRLIPHTAELASWAR